MNNNKGLTLVEVIAVLVVLSIIAVIVTPNLAVSIKDYKQRVMTTQLSSITGATKNWVADNIDKVTCTTDNTSALAISISELQTGAYLDEKIKNPYGGYMDDTDAFGLVSCKEIVDETGKLQTNYDYTYGAYLDISDYQKKRAIEYIKDTTKQSGQVTTSTLQSNGYMYTSIKDASNKVVSIPSKTINVTVTEDDDGTLKYEASIN